MNDSPRSALPAHGGNLAWAEAHFGRPADGWLDLSTGINPAPYPRLECTSRAFAELPSRAAVDRLLTAARQAYRLPTGAAICAAPGTQALIQLLPILHAAPRVAVVSPTYSEHAKVWRDAGRAVDEIDDPARTEADIVILTNPNNPDGRRFGRAALRTVGETLAARGGLLVVDEAFADVTQDISVTAEAGFDGMIVLRSFGKFFGLAGLRLGFAIGPPPLIERLEASLGPWAVSGPALEVGTRALGDAGWIEQTLSDLASRRARLDEVLHAAGFEIVGGTDLFRLTRRPDATVVWRALGGAGILTRAFPDRPDWLRFGLPGDDAAFARLDAALGCLRRE